ncbi:excinuclease ABC subunit C [Arenicella xantha]|uniref:UvrABC system protein C n=2 Tax=Arenicella xantha TaxID=644221 RepID=A0A395JJ73_9GAMM|nr:excinuclease ABC subunit C [Arenicella xantha]
MFDAQGALLYVGKAKNLKKRLSSYFRTTGLPIKTEAMMQKVEDIQVVVTHTENEALILESNLIKQHKPRYNILLRDSKSYPFIHIDDSHDYPRLSFYRGDRSQPGRYFGPYPGVTAIRDTLALLQKVLPVRQCDDVFFSNRSRPCLQYQIKRCSGPCVGVISKEDYSKDIELAALFLQGKDDSLNTLLQTNMEKASKNLKFEEAAGWRDRINALRRVQSHQSITAGHSDIDIITVATLHGKVCVEVTFIRGGRHSGSNGHFPKVPLDFTEVEILSAFITQYYHRRSAPKEILVGQALPDGDNLETWLTEQGDRKVSIVHSVRGHRRDWLQMAQLNVTERLKRHMSEKQSVEKRLQALSAVFQLEQQLTRIECFDISHTQGEQTVASCVVFTEKGITKSDYRRYNITGITPGDDYAAMRQAIMRRYKRVLKEEGKLPDLLLIDGGKGQLSSAAEIMRELQITDVLLVGVAKGEGRKPGLETLFVEGQSIGIKLAANSPAMHLVQQIRDEAHRFAITGHRARRGKAQTQSILQEIPGIGAKRRQALLKHFGGLQGIQQAGMRDLAKVTGINEDLADKIYHYLRK